MNKIGIVFKFEVIRQLKKPSFWISLLLLPVAIFAIIGLSSLSGYNIEDQIANQSFENKKVGLTDDNNILGEAGDVFEKIATEEEGKNKVINGELNIYYYVAPDFKETRKVKIYERADENGIMSFNSIPFAEIMKSTVYSKLSVEEIAMIEGALDFETIDLDANGNSISVLGRAVIPLAVLAIFYVLICVFGNRLTMSLVEEKENRISELLLTAVSSRSFVIGKILSLIVLGFIQIAVFIIPIIATLIIYRDNPAVSSIVSVIEWQPAPIIGNILLLLFSYFVFAGACTFISSLCPTARDASQYIGFVMVTVILPLIFMNELMSSNVGVVGYILSYFPLSAPIALMLRNAFGNLPTIELIIGLADLAIAAVIVMGLTVKSFQKNAINFSVVKPKLGIRKSWKR